MNTESIQLMFNPNTTMILMFIPSPWLNADSHMTLAATEKWIAGFVSDLLDEPNTSVSVQSRHAGEDPVFIHVQVDGREMTVPLYKDTAYTSVAFMLQPLITMFIRTDLYPGKINRQRWFKGSQVAHLVNGESRLFTYSNLMSEMNVFMQDRFGLPTLAPRFLFKRRVDEGEITAQQAVDILMQDLHKRHIHATSEIIVKDWVDAGLPPRHFAVDLKCFKEGQCTLQ